MTNSVNLPVYSPSLGTAPVQNTNAPVYQPTVAPVYNAPSYNTDNVNIAYTTPVVQQQPQVQVGMFDKVSAYFKDVYRSDGNLKAYKLFEQDMKANPSVYLQVGSSSKESVLDLQQKLTIVGIKCNVNGTFGKATGEAVAEFKEMTNINDGFLNKNGQPARTGIATPQMWTVLNAMVSKKLNPGSQVPGSGNPMPVSQEELNWAGQIQNKVTNFGYKPTKQEYTKYNDILERAQAQNQPTVATQQPQAPVAQSVTQEELNWALQLQNRINNFGYKPTQQEVATFNDIYTRQANQQTVTTQPVTVTSQPQAPVSVTPSNGVSQEELNWAANLQDKIDKQGYQPTQQEVAQYNDIFTRYQAAGQVAPQQQVTAASSNGVSQEELNWAANLQDKVDKQGYQPTQQEIAQYNDIFTRYQAAGQVAPQQQVTAASSNGVSQEELNWALALQNKVEKEGYKPNQQEVAQYTDIFNRYQASQDAPQVQAPASQPTTVQTATPVVPQGNAVVIGNARGDGTKSVWQSAIGRVPGLTGNWNVDRDNLYWVGPNGETIKQTDLTPNQAASLTGAWRLVFNPSGASNQTVAPQQTPVAPQNSNVPTNGLVTQEELNWAANLYDRVSKGYAPTQEEVAKFNQIQLNAVRTVSGQSTAPVVPSAATMQAAPVTQEELNWAIALQDKVNKQGYQATPQEVAQYTDIFNRYQKTGSQSVTPTTQPAPVVSNAPVSAAPVTQEELNWALALQDKVTNQGYQPTQQEMAAYTDIFTRYQSSQAIQTPTATPQQPQVNTTNNQFVTVDANSSDPQLQWALNILDRFRLGYQPTDEEMRKYEEIIARFQIPSATP